MIKKQRPCVLSFLDSKIITAAGAYCLRQSWSCHFLALGLKISLASVQSQDRQQGCRSLLLPSEVCHVSRCYIHTVAAEFQPSSAVRRET